MLKVRKREGVLIVLALAAVWYLGLVPGSGPASPAGGAGLASEISSKLQSENGVLKAKTEALERQLAGVTAQLQQEDARISSDERAVAGSKEALLEQVSAKVDADLAVEEAKEQVEHAGLAAQEAELKAKLVSLLAEEESEHSALHSTEQDLAHQVSFLAEKLAKVEQEVLGAISPTTTKTAAAAAAVASLPPAPPPLPVPTIQPPQPLPPPPLPPPAPAAISYDYSSMGSLDERDRSADPLPPACAAPSFVASASHFVCAVMFALALAILTSAGAPCLCDPSSGCTSTS